MKRKPFASLFYEFGFLSAVLFACLTVSIFHLSTTEAQEIAWEADFDRAVVQAKTSNRLLFIHFYGDDCPPCKLMENHVFTNAQVIGQINRDFVALKVKVSDQPNLAKKYSVKAIPTDLILSADGQLVHRRQGGITTDRFVEYLRFLLNSVQNGVQNTATKQIPMPSLNQSLPELAAPQTAVQVPSQNQIPVLYPAVVQPPVASAAAEPLRDPFTKQPVIAPLVPTNLTPPERINPIRVVENRSEEKTMAPEPVAPVVPIVSPLTFRETVSASPIFPTASSVTPVFPVGPPSNSDEIATTMVEVPLGLEGYCPVVLSTEERWIPGNPAYYTMFRGHVFRFSSEETMTEFMKSPEKYAPVAMGEDIVQMVDRNKKIYGNRKFGAWFQGRVFLFCNQESLDAFAARPEYYAEIALKYETAFKGIPGRF